MILLLDTSTKELLVGLAADTGEVLAHVRRQAREGERGIHDARLASEVRDLLLQADASPKSNTRIAIVVGPGSFTGLRIGLSFAKGLAFATGAAIVPVTQHECLAREVVGEADFIVTEGYRPGMYYVARAGQPDSIELVTDLTALHGQRVIAHGAMLGTVPDAIEHCSFAEITADALARLALTSMSISGEAIDALEPLYLTDFTPGLR